MSTLAQLAGELNSWFSQIDPLAAQPLLKRAYGDILAERDWSFLKITGSWFNAAPVTSGTVTVTQFSKTVVADATATPLWTPLVAPAAPQTPMTQRQFRVTGGPVYNIVAYDGASTITLDRFYTEQSGAGSTYMIYQPYVPAPTTDFKRWMAWTDIANNYSFHEPALYTTQAELDRYDPNRQCFSLPMRIAFHDYVLMPGNTQMTPRFELWPHPVQQLAYIIEYAVNGGNPSMTAVIPPQIQDQLVMARARRYGHEVVANQPNVDYRIKAFHLTAIRNADAEYVDLLAKAKRLDNDVSDSQVSNARPGPHLSGPIDAGYLQSHELYVLP